MHETELHSELQRLKSQMKAIDASIAAAQSQLENLKREDERTVWETNIVILKASAACKLPLWSFSMLELPEMMMTPFHSTEADSGLEVMHVLVQAPGAPHPAWPLK